MLCMGNCARVIKPLRRHSTRGKAMSEHNFELTHCKNFRDSQSDVNDFNLKQKRKK